ncbi:MAG: heme-binding protein [Treponema sp.]|jgi:uncharacterized protein (UPF0303 family)|nr:heme-binding protein [Treponema sp.]
MDINEGIDILEKQEEILQFTHFNRQDAWKLGKELAAIILEEGLRLTVSVKLRDGFTLFQYAAEGTTVNNETWMIRKFNTVREFEASSLLTTLKHKKRNQTLESRGFETRLYAASGGGFPIRIKGSGLIGAVLASGCPHLQDHDTLVQGIARVLRIRDLPRIPLDAGL